MQVYIAVYIYIYIYALTGEREQQLAEEWVKVLMCNGSNTCSAYFISLGLAFDTASSCAGGMASHVHTHPDDAPWTGTCTINGIMIMEPSYSCYTPRLQRTQRRVLLAPLKIKTASVQLRFKSIKITDIERIRLISVIFIDLNLYIYHQIVWRQIVLLLVLYTAQRRCKVRGKAEAKWSCDIVVVNQVVLLPWSAVQSDCSVL